MYNIKYIILLLFFIILINLYLVIYYYNENQIIKQIIKDWIEKTDGGNIRIDEDGRYKDDYYLSIYNYKDDDSHIHLIKNCNEGELCYVIEKNNKHSKTYIINKNSNIDDLVNNMIENYNNFK